MRREGEDGGGRRVASRNKEGQKWAKGGEDGEMVGKVRSCERIIPKLLDIRDMWSRCRKRAMANDPPEDGWKISVIWEIKVTVIQGMVLQVPSANDGRCLFN